MQCKIRNSFKIIYKGKARQKALSAGIFKIKKQK
jgi:hypothetical protein